MALISEREAAARLGISYRSLMLARLDKKLSFPHIRVPPRAVRYDSDDIDAFIRKAKTDSLGGAEWVEKVATDEEYRAWQAFQKHDDATLVAEARSMLLLEGAEFMESRCGTMLKQRNLWPLPPLGAVISPSPTDEDDDDAPRDND
jgi:predicted DNA-binding transcriptional regulator AlpA